jgi:hypothetical protein
VVTTHYNRAVLIGINDTIAEAVAQVFEADIKGMAQELSPVDRGTNRRSITTETQRTPNGSVQAEIFTQSGYGGYLELGHRVHVGPKGSEEFRDEPVEGKPYIYPAFIAGQPALLEAVKDGLGGGGIKSTEVRKF